MSKLPFQHATDSLETDKAWHASGERLNDQTEHLQPKARRSVEYNTWSSCTIDSCCKSKRAGEFKVQLILIMQSTVDGVTCRSTCKGENENTS